MAKQLKIIQRMDHTGRTETNFICPVCRREVDVTDAGFAEAEGDGTNASRLREIIARHEDRWHQDWVLANLRVGEAQRKKELTAASVKRLAKAFT